MRREPEGLRDAGRGTALAGPLLPQPLPLSEKYFLAAYSFDALIGEPDANKANMFGLYLVDAFGNKELLYRDLNIASQWPVPLRARHRPPVLPDRLDPRLGEEGTYFVQDVYQSNVELPPGSVKGLRILQVLPKTTPTPIIRRWAWRTPGRAGRCAARRRRKKMARPFSARPPGSR